MHYNSAIYPSIRITKPNGGVICFVDGLYKTDDPEEIAFLDVNLGTSNFQGIVKLDVAEAERKFLEAKAAKDKPAAVQGAMGTSPDGGSSTELLAAIKADKTKNPSNA